MALRTPLRPSLDLHCIQPAAHLVPLVAQLKGSAGRHDMLHVSDAYLCHNNYRCARKEPPHGTRSCAQPRNDSSKVSGLRQGAARDRLRGGPTTPLRLRCARSGAARRCSVPVSSG